MESKCHAFFALLAIYAIWRVFNGGKFRWLLICFISLAFAIQAHYLGLLLLPTILVWWLLAVKKEKVDRQALLHSTAISFIVFILLMSPIVLFDIRHQFLNSRAMLTFFSQRQTTVNFKVYKAVPNLLPILERMTTSLLTAGSKHLGTITSSVILFGTIVLFIRRYKVTSLRLLVTWVSFGIIGLGLYKQSLFDHYYGFIFPAIFLIAGALIDYLWETAKVTRVAVIVAFMGLLYLNLSASPLLATPYDLYQHAQVISREIVQSSGGKDFNLGMIANQNYDESYRFILRKWGAPLKEMPPDLTEQLFVVCELPVSQCNPVGHPKAEIANFGWAKIDSSRSFPWGVTLYKLIHNKP